MSNNAMSNETNLDWLARNVHVWREGKREVLVCWPRNVATLIWSYTLSDAGWITKDQWLARRAELQNKPGWANHQWPQIFQNEDGHWFGARAGWDFKAHIGGGWKGEGVSLLRDDGEYLQSGEVLGDWRDTLERRPADLSEPAVTERLTEATQNVLAAVPNLLGEQFKFEHNTKPVTVSNETVKLEQPITVTGTGNGSASESAFLVGRVIDLLRTSVDHFSADELADLNELTGAELTKRDAAVCGGQKYIDAHWHERGELPPVGTVCLYVVSDRLSAEVEITAHAKFGLCFVEVGKSGENYVSKTAELHRFRPIPTERDVLLSVIVEEINHYDTDGKLADAILAAGFSLRDK